MKTNMVSTISVRIRSVFIPTRKVRALGCARAEEGNREKKSKGKNKKKKWKEKIKKKLGFPEPLKSVVVKVSMHIYS